MGGVSRRSSALTDSLCPGGDQASSRRLSPAPRSVGAPLGATSRPLGTIGPAGRVSIRASMLRSDSACFKSASRNRLADEWAVKWRRSAPRSVRPRMHGRSRPRQLRSQSKFSERSNIFCADRHPGCQRLDGLDGGRYQGRARHYRQQAFDPEGTAHQACSLRRHSTAWRIPRTNTKSVSR